MTKSCQKNIDLLNHRFKLIKFPGVAHNEYIGLYPVHTKSKDHQTWYTWMSRPCEETCQFSSVSDSRGSCKSKNHVAKCKNETFVYIIHTICSFIFHMYGQFWDYFGVRIWPRSLSQCNLFFFFYQSLRENCKSDCL